MAERLLTLRITLLSPPAGVLYALQEGDDTPVAQVLSTGADIAFDVPVRVAEGPDGGPRFLGPHVRREGQRRFVYFRLGVPAGQHDSPWSRRGKIFITDIDPALVAAALAAGRPIAASFPGVDRKGEPSCATVKPIDGWHIA